MKPSAIPSEPNLQPALSRSDRFVAALLTPGVLIRIVLALTLISYLRTVLFDFVYDDKYLIILNPWIDSWKFVPVIFKKSLWGFLEAPQRADYYRPLVMLVLIATRGLAGAAPAWFHLVAIGIHLAAVYLVFALLRRLSGDARLAVVASAIFGLHPSRVESVAWISGISDSLCLIFFLASAIAYLKWKEREDAHRWLVFSVWLLFLGTLSKETLVLGPLLLGMYEFVTASGRPVKRAWQAIRLMLPYAVTMAFTLALRAYALRGFHAPPVALTTKLQVAFWSAPEAMFWYLRQQVWPLGLSVHYPILREEHFSWLHFALPLLIVGILFAIVVRCVRGRPLGQFLLAWYLLTLAPVVVFVFTVQLHDRYLYLPSVASSAGVAWVILKLVGSRPWRQATAFAALFGCLSGLTIYNAGFWDNDFELFHRAVAIGYNNGGAYHGMITAYLDNGQLNEAIQAGRGWIQRADDPSNAWYILGALWMAKKDYVQARIAFNHANSAFLAGRMPLPLGDLDMAEGDCVMAEHEYRASIQSQPSLSWLHTKLASALRCLGRTDEAQREVHISQRLREQLLH